MVEMTEVLWDDQISSTTLQNESLQTLSDIAARTARQRCVLVGCSQRAVFSAEVFLGAVRRNAMGRVRPLLESISL